MARLVAALVVDIDSGMFLARILVSVLPTLCSRILVGMDEKDSCAVPALVLDCSSGTCCAGFAGCDAPRVVFPFVDDWSLMLGTMAGMEQKDSILRVRCARGRLQQWHGHGWFCCFFLLALSSFLLSSGP